MSSAKTLRWQHLRVALVVGHALMLSGCASYRAQPLDPLAELAGLAHRDVALLVKANTDAGNPLIDLTDGLDERELVAVALRLNPDLVAKRASLGQSEAALIEAGLWPNPELGFAIRAGPPGITGNADLLAALLRPGERAARLDAATAGKTGALAALAAEEWGVVVAVRRARLDLLAAEALRAATAEAADVSKTVFTAMTRKRELGETSDLDVANATWDFAEAKRQVREAMAAVDHARRELNRICGVPSEATLTLTGFGQPVAVTDVPTPPENELDRAVLAGRWELAEGKSNYERCEHELRLAITKQYPTLKLGPSASREEGGTTIGLGVSVDLRIFDRNQGGIRAAEAARDEARARYIALLHRLLADAHAAAADLKRATTETAALDADLMPAARKAITLADRALAAHDLTVIDYLAARRQWLAAQRVQVAAITALGRAAIDLDAALGRGPTGLARPTDNATSTGPAKPSEASP